MKLFKSLVVWMCFSVSAAALAETDYKAECVRSLESPDASQVEACKAITDELPLSCVQYLEAPTAQAIRSCGAIRNENALGCVNAYQSLKSVAPNVFTSDDIDRCSRVTTEEQFACVISLNYPQFAGFDSCIK